MGVLADSNNGKRGHVPGITWERLPAALVGKRAIGALRAGVGSQPSPVRVKGDGSSREHLVLGKQTLRAAAAAASGSRQSPVAQSPLEGEAFCPPSPFPPVTPVSRRCRSRCV